MPEDKEKENTNQVRLWYQRLSKKNNFEINSFILMTNIKNLHQILFLGGRE